MGEAFRARCLRRPWLWARLRRRTPHEAPRPDCECGIYAAALEHVGYYLAGLPAWRRDARVLGRVALWGCVVECQRGFRASHAYPSRLYVPADAAGTEEGGCEEVVEGLRRYGVPVEVLRSPSAEATRVLAERLAA